MVYHEKLNNSWISIDFENKKLITKLRIQGEPIKNNKTDDRSYVLSLWSDYSNDGTQWTCHNNNDGEYKLEYKHFNENIWCIG